MKTSNLIFSFRRGSERASCSARRAYSAPTFCIVVFSRTLKPPLVGAPSNRVFKKKKKTRSTNSLFNLFGSLTNIFRHFFPPFLLFAGFLSYWITSLNKVISDEIALYSTDGWKYHWKRDTFIRFIFFL